MTTEEKFNPDNYPDMESCPQCGNFMDSKSEICDECQSEQNYQEEEEEGA